MNWEWYTIYLVAMTINTTTAGYREEREEGERTNQKKRYLCLGCFYNLQSPHPWFRYGCLQQIHTEQGWCRQRFEKKRFCLNSATDRISKATAQGEQKKNSGLGGDPLRIYHYRFKWFTTLKVDLNTRFAFYLLLPLLHKAVLAWQGYLCHSTRNAIKFCGAD